MSDKVEAAAIIYSNRWPLIFRIGNVFALETLQGPQSSGRNTRTVTHRNRPDIPRIPRRPRGDTVRISQQPQQPAEEIHTRESEKAEFAFKIAREGTKSNLNNLQTSEGGQLRKLLFKSVRAQSESFEHRRQHPAGAVERPIKARTCERVGMGQSPELGTACRRSSGETEPIDGVSQDTASVSYEESDFKCDTKQQRCYNFIGNGVGEDDTNSSIYSRRGYRIRYLLFLCVRIRLILINIKKLSDTYFYFLFKYLLRMKP